MSWLVEQTSFEDLRSVPVSFPPYLAPPLSPTEEWIVGDGRREWEREGGGVRERERVSEWVCERVCVREREREREWASECRERVCEREREWASECRERESVRERGREGGSEYLNQLLQALPTLLQCLKSEPSVSGEGDGVMKEVVLWGRQMEGGMETEEVRWGERGKKKRERERERERERQRERHRERETERERERQRETETETERERVLSECSRVARYAVGLDLPVQGGQLFEVGASLR